MGKFVRGCPPGNRGDRIVRGRGVVDKRVCHMTGREVRVFNSGQGNRFDGGQAYGTSPRTARLKEGRLLWGGSLNPFAEPILVSGVLSWVRNPRKGRTRHVYFSRKALVEISWGKGMFSAAKRKGQIRGKKTTAQRKKRLSETQGKKARNRSARVGLEQVLRPDGSHSGRGSAIWKENPRKIREVSRLKKWRVSFKRWGKDSCPGVSIEKEE